LDHDLGQEVYAGRAGFRFPQEAVVPETLTKEFLQVDLVNNLDKLAEDREQVLARVKERAAHSDRNLLKRAVQEYGMVRTKSSTLT